MARKTKAAVHPVEQVATAAATDSQNTPLTRKSRLVALLGQDGGCTLAAISEAFGWKPHTTRAAIAGLRKEGHAIETTTGDGGTGYRIVAKAPCGPQPAVSRK